MDGNLSFHNLLQDEGQTGFEIETLNRVNVRNTVHVSRVSLINKQLLSIRCSRLQFIILLSWEEQQINQW